MCGHTLRQTWDNTGQFLNNQDYDPYGVPYQTSTLSLGYTGELTDPNGLVYLRARTYAPALGTFLTRDPVEGVMERVVSRNGYGYVEGNPVNWTDPTGLCSQNPAQTTCCGQTASERCYFNCMLLLRGAASIPEWQRGLFCRIECLPELPSLSTIAAVAAPELAKWATRAGAASAADGPFLAGEAYSSLDLLTTAIRIYVTAWNLAEMQVEAREAVLRQQAQIEAILLPCKDLLPNLEEWVSNTSVNISLMARTRTIAIPKASRIPLSPATKTCSDGEYSKLTGNIHGPSSKCDVPRKCDGITDCGELALRIERGYKCLEARAEITNKCFGGRWDASHAKAYEDVARGLQNCRDKYFRLCKTTPR